ncbi:SUN domain-containing protein 2-like [Silurus meridionalis]|nr:SUN domain-containing protein 2-like [Silurus meridionalis]
MRCVCVCVCVCVGAKIIASSESHKTKYCKMLGFSFWCQNNGPETVIQPEVFPGKCWAFKGSEGYLVISLPSPIHVTNVTLEHLPRVLSPTQNIHSAPKEFSVYGRVSMNDEGKHLGTFTYDQDGEPIQTFQLPDSSTEPYQLVELRILSNWGHPDYTCVYRFRIHSQ